MLLRNLDCDGTQLHAPLPPLAAHELLIIDKYKEKFVILQSIGIIINKK